MDTKAWGPDAWDLLHCIVNNYPETNTQSQKTKYSRFFNNLQHILPCIYCRQSLTKFYEQYPMNMKSSREFNKWFFKIHNCVNNKLRKQGFLHSPNPRQHKINKHYSQYASTCVTDNKYPGWNFIYCICTNYPKKTSTTAPLRRHYKRFFNYLLDVIPFPKVKKDYRKYLQTNPIQENIDTRAALFKWFYNFEISCQSCQGKKLTLTETKKKYERYRAVCDKSLGICCSNAKIK